MKVSINGDYHNNWMVYSGKSANKMDDPLVNQQFLVTILGIIMIYNHSYRLVLGVLSSQ
jgi:hypothetical protein